jgi:queuine/archaeosine tRNA-ribosyltransferase
MDSIPRAKAQHTNPCPICGKQKVAWSVKCSTCEGNRRRYLAAIERADADKQFLLTLEQAPTLQVVATEMNITRQRVHQLKADAMRRLAFLQQNPIPPLSATM